MVKEVVDADEFSKEVAKEALTIVDFYADSCESCQRIAPVIESFAKKYKDCNFIKVNVDNAKRIAEESGIDAMPTFLLYIQGELKGKIIGTNTSDIEQKIIELCPPKNSLGMENENVVMSKLRSLAAEKMVVDDELKQVEGKRFLGFHGILEFALLTIVTKNYSNALIKYRCEGNDDIVDKKLEDLVKFDVQNKDDVTLKIFIKLDFKNDEDEIITMDFVGRFDCFELPSSGIEERRDVEFKGIENEFVVINCKMRSSYMNLNDEKNRLDNLMHELNHAIAESEEALSKSTAASTKKNSKNNKKVTKKSPKKTKKVIEDIDEDGDVDETGAPATSTIMPKLTGYLELTTKVLYANRSIILFGISVPIILFFGEMASV